MEKILILDIETTGFLNSGGKIVEVGMVELDLSNGERKIIFSEVCHENGITKEEVENAWEVVSGLSKNHKELKCIKTPNSSDFK